MSSLSAPLLYAPRALSDAAARRREEPVTCGIPWPAGAVREIHRLRLIDAAGSERPLQARTLDLWPDGSVRWSLLDWLARDEDELRVEVAASDGPAPESGPLTVETGESGVTVATGRARYALSVGGLFPFDRVEVGDGEAIDPERSGISARDDANCPYGVVVKGVEVEETGPIRVTLKVTGSLSAAGGSSLLEITSRIHLFRDAAFARIVIGLTNPRAAGHPGGFWSLGSDGSIYLRDLSFALATPSGSAASAVALSAEPSMPLTEVEAPLELFQASSGGESWRSRAHADRYGEVPLAFRGYRTQAGAAESEGARATPEVEVRHSAGSLAVCVPDFWQNFPKAVEAGAAGIIARLFPRQQGSNHEIQGGEQKTHELWVAFADDGGAARSISWARDPLLPHSTPEWYAASGAIPQLTPAADDPNPGYIELVGQALDGEDSLERKREAVDEYGWRHFGDVWADHEAARHEGDGPLISHYNNQYDMVGGFAVQFLRSGDPRWHRLMTELARHVVDIDLYHTDRDKSAYNGGMFWHTVHYIDAGLATHRSYPRAPGVPGGGPSSGHLYSAGLRLHHLLTGDPDALDAVIQLGEYVIRADDGRRTIFRLLDRGDTGHVSNSGFDDYHGPGRSGANAVAALLQAHRASPEERYLEKAEQLLRRCIHPDDDLEALELLDADRKWFYTMFLQSLGEYLDYKIELGQLDESYAYGRAALLHYARWAAEHEYPYLEKPEILEFPTETWAAQDLRKSEMFRIAARHADDELRARFLERGRFFFDAAVDRLRQEPTSGYCRPLALLLSNGWRQAWFDRHDPEPAPEPVVRAVDFGTPQLFISQKRRALKKAKRLLVGAWALAVLGLGAAALMLWLGGP